MPITFTCCPLCESLTSKHMFTHKFAGKLVRCECCDLVYVEERATASWIEMRQKAPKPLPEMIIRRGMDQEPDSRKILKRLKHYKDHGTLIELGSFTGHFLNLARELNYDVVGIEPDPWVADFARREYGLEVHETLLPDLHFPAKTFDIVVMLQVMEHLTDPNGTLLEIRRTLTDSGIVVIEIPIIDLIFFRLLGKRHRHVVLDHILYFSEATLRKFMEKNGFCHIYSERVGRTIRLKRLAQVAQDHCKPLGKLLKVFFRLLRIDDKRVSVNLRDMVLAYYRKKPEEM